MAKPHPSGGFLVAGEAQPLWNPRQVVVVRRAKEDPPGRDDQTSRSPHIFHQFISVFEESLGPRKVHFDYGVILVNMVISVILGHEKIKIQNILDLGKIDVFFC